MIKVGYLIIAAFVLLAVGGYFLYNEFYANEEDVNGNLANETEDTGIQPQNNTVTNQTNAEPTTYNIDIEDFAFKTSSLTIKAGDTIIWTNKDSTRHTVTSDSGNELDSAFLAQGESYTHIFTQAGTFAYHCAPHPGMKGTIIVE